MLICLFHMLIYQWIGGLHADQMFRIAAEAKGEGLGPVKLV